MEADCCLILLKVLQVGFSLALCGYLAWKNDFVY